MQPKENQTLTLDPLVRSNVIDFSFSYPSADLSVYTDML